MTTRTQHTPSLHEALVIPVKALVESDRALTSVVLTHLYTGLRARDDGVHEPIRMPIELSCGPADPDAPPPVIRVEPPVLALTPAPNVRVQRATVDFTWALGGMARAPAEPGHNGKGAPRALLGKPSVGRDRARRSDRAAKVAIRLSLQRGEPTEGALRVKDRLTVAGIRAIDRGTPER